MNKLILRDITKIYELKNRNLKIPVLLGVNLELDSSKLNFIYGPSGSGKSTLLNIISQALNPTTGRILFNDAVVKDLDNRNFKVSYYKQNPYENVFPTLSIYQNYKVVSNINNLNLSKEQIKKKLEELNINADIHKHMDQLSTGQIQRIGVSLNLLTSPDILILDEPTSHLDKENSLNLIQMILNFQKKANCLTVISSHNQKLAYNHNQFVIFDGRIAKQSIEDHIVEYQELMKYHIKSAVDSDKESMIGIIEFVITIEKEKIRLPKRIFIILNWNTLDKIDVQIKEDKLEIRPGDAYEPKETTDDVVIDLIDSPLSIKRHYKGKGIANLQNNLIEVFMEE
jgi:ABC-type multidrug transport system ATPase subunit